MRQLCTCQRPDRMVETPDDDARCTCGGRIVGELGGRCHDCGHAADIHDRRGNNDSCDDCNDAAQVGHYAPCATR